MTDLPPSLKEVINDEDRERAKTELLALIRQLQDEDVKDRSILRALHDVMMVVCEELPTANRQYHFLEYVRDSAQRVIGHFDAIIEKDKHTEH